MTALPWTRSKLDAFDTCPRQFEQVQVLRHFESPRHEANMWGDKFHKQAEKFIGAQGNTPLSAEMLPYSAYFAQFLGRPGNTFVERRYALNRQLAPCDFFADDVWCRSILDVLTLHEKIADVDDHKTGKNRKKDMQQLIINALVVFYHHPEIEVCRTAFHWVQQGFGEDAKDRETFYRWQIPELWTVLMPKLQRYREAFHAETFPPKKSGLCKKHCPVNTCEYWGGGHR